MDQLLSACIPRIDEHISLQMSRVLVECEIRGLILDPGPVIALILVSVTVTGKVVLRFLGIAVCDRLRGSSGKKRDTHQGHYQKIPLGVRLPTLPLCSQMTQYAIRKVIHVFGIVQSTMSSDLPLSDCPYRRYPPSS
jgi:hypothetical protein